MDGPQEQAVWNSFEALCRSLNDICSNSDSFATEIPGYKNALSKHYIRLFFVHCRFVAICDIYENINV